MSSPSLTYDMLTSGHHGYAPLLPSGLLLGSPFTPGTPTAFHTGHFPTLNAYPPSPTVPGSSRNMGGYATNNGLLSPQMQTYPGFYSPQQQNQGTQMDQNSLQITTISDYNSPLPSPNPFVASVPGAQTCRTVYLGNVPSEALAEEILDNVRTGPIESIRILPEKNCAFISFLDVPSAQIFHTDATMRKLTIGGQEVKIGWGKPSSISASVMLAVQQNGASRNVFLGNLPEDVTREEIEEDLGKFGAIEHVKLIKEKNIGFVHFLSIANAMKAVQQLPSEAKYAQRRVYYGKDRCGPHHKSAVNANPMVASQIYNSLSFSNMGMQPMYDMMGMTAIDRDGSPSIVQNLGNRTVYLGNIHPETTLEEICNVVRGGILHHIRYIPDKHICFVTFVDSNAAVAFYQMSTLQGLMIHNRRLKIGWGKHSGPLPPGIAIAVHAGASRNVYVGNVDFETFSEDKLRQDFSEYGDIELVNTLREKSCAFVNFTNISSAIKAIDGASQKEEFKKLKINFGKDRCGNPPRTTASNTAAGNSILENTTDLCTAQVVPAGNIYGPYSAPLTTTSSTTSNGSGVYIDQNVQYTQYLAPQHYQSTTVSITYPDSVSPVDQNGSASPEKLDVRLSGHARAVSLPASVVMQSTGSDSEQVNGHYDVDQRMYGLGLEASE
jgi:RNA recognition motif-containing protein